MPSKPLISYKVNKIATHPQMHLVPSVKQQQKQNVLKRVKSCQLFLSHVTISAAAVQRAAEPRGEPCKERPPSNGSATVTSSSIWEQCPRRRKHDLRQLAKSPSSASAEITLWRRGVGAGRICPPSPLRGWNESGGAWPWIASYLLWSQRETWSYTRPNRLRSEPRRLSTGAWESGPAPLTLTCPMGDTTQQMHPFDIHSLALHIWLMAPHLVYSREGHAQPCGISPVFNVRIRKLAKRL